METVAHSSRDIHVRMQFAARYALGMQKENSGALLVLCQFSPVSGQKRNADEDEHIAYCLLNKPPEFQTPQFAL